MLNRHRWAGALITAVALLALPGTVRAHGGGGHGGGGHGGGGFHGGGFHGGGFHGGGFGHYGYGGYGYRGFGYGGFGYPFGYGLGFGLGYGLGYGGFGYGGFGYGYPYGYGLYGYGYPYAYGGYGYPYAYGGYGNGVPYGAGGYGYGYPYAANGGYGNGFAYRYRPTFAPTPVVAANAPAPAPVVATTVRRPPTAGNFAQQGDDAFRSGNYTAAARAWQHAQIDEPNNGTLTLKVAQAQFASGQFPEAADAVHQAMATLPSTQWGSVVRNRAQMYGANAGDYAAQLKALESAAQNQPPNSANQFLLAYHYAFTGRSADATRLLDDDLKLAPQNATARALRDMTQPKFAPPSPEPRATAPVLSRKPQSAAPRDVLDL